MTNRKRHISLLTHGAFVVGLLAAGSLSSVLLWQWLLNSWWLGIVAVLLLEGTALVGFGLRIAMIPSPFQAARHLIPVLSVPAIGYELWLLMAGHQVGLKLGVVSIAVGVFALLTTLSTREIERVAANRTPLDQAEEQTRVIREQLARAAAEQEALHRLISLYRGETGDTPTEQRETPLLPAPVPTEQNGTAGETLEQLTEQVRNGALSLREAARRAGVSPGTMKRRIDNGQNS